MTKNPETLNARFETQRQELLRANGWTYGMWRWYWVWRKQVHDASFMCMSTREALLVESALQSSADCYPAPDAGVMAVDLPHWPIIYAILRPALSTGNIAVRQHAERLAEVLQGDQLAALRGLLDRQPAAEPPARVVHAGGVKERYLRKPEADKRTSRGDDFAGDAWLDTETGETVYTVVGFDRNEQPTMIVQDGQAVSTAGVTASDGKTFSDKPPTEGYKE